jgi:hypothetical protein
VTRKTSKSAGTSFVGEQRQPTGVQGGGEWTSGAVNPLARQAAGYARSQARAAAAVQAEGGKPPGATGGGGGSGGGSGSGSGGSSGSHNVGRDRNAARDRARAQQDLAEAAQLEQQIQRLQGQLKKTTAKVRNLRQASRAGAARGATTQSGNQNVAAVTNQTTRGSQAPGASTVSMGRLSQQLANAKGKQAQLRQQIASLKARRSTLLTMAARLLRIANSGGGVKPLKKTTSPSVTKGSEQGDDLRERLGLITALAGSGSVTLTAGQLHDLLG